MDVQGPETRRRSRSKTPTTLRKSVDKEAGGDAEKKPVRKSPTVVTITEEETMPELDELGENVIIRVTRQSTKIITSDYSSDDGVEGTKSSEGGDKETAATTQKSALEQFQSPLSRPGVLTKTVNTGKFTAASDSTASSTKTVVTETTSSKVTTKAASKSNESHSNDVTKFLDRTTSSLRTSTPKTKGTLKQSVLELSNGDKSNVSAEHIAYREYSDAGEYWNKVPKTDYTYSKLSPHRRELADGFIAMPNMSRSSFQRHADRVTSMVRNNPQQETYIRERYQNMSARSFSGIEYTNLLSDDNTVNSNATFDARYDSQDEIDVAQFERRRVDHNSRVVRQHQETLMKRVFLSIVTTIYTFGHSVTRLFNRTDHNMYYTRMEVERSWYSKLFSYVSGATLSLFRYFYLFISSILYLDCWLLQSTKSTDKKKRFLLLLLILLPLLLFGGICIYLDPPANLSLSLPNFQFDNPISPERIDAVKATTFDAIDTVKAGFVDSFDYLRAISHKSFDEVQKIWNENVGE